jgi:hypothetical protein
MGAALVPIAVVVSIVMRSTMQLDGPRWHIKGMFTEACTCAPPCTCNFGLAPSPNDFCHSIFSYGIRTGEYNGVTLDGLVLACVHGERGYFWLIDRRATAPQAAALSAIAERIIPVQRRGQKTPGRLARAIRPAWITHEVTSRGSRVWIDGAGGFDNTFLLGFDGTTPVVVLNNSTFNLKRSMKGKTGVFRYKDSFGNHIDYRDTNSNTGEFEYDQNTRQFIRGVPLSMVSFRSVHQR